MAPNSTVLLVDDNPAHLTLYSLILEQAGHRASVLLVEGSQPEFPSSGVDLILLDYRLGMVSSAELAKKLRAHFPAAPIIVLSDMQWMPQDIAPYATTFVRKGEPEQLLATIAATIGNTNQED